MPKTNESTMKWKVDITQLKAGMQEAKRSISLANAEFKSATAGLTGWQNSITGVEAKLRQLNTVSDNQKKVLSALERQYEVTARELGETSPQAEKLKIQIENQRAAIGKTESQLRTYTDKLNTLQKEQRESDTAFSKLNKTIEEQEKELGDLKKAYANAVIEYGKNSDEAKDLARQIKELSGELKTNKTSMENAEKAADDLDRSMDEVDDSARSVSDGFTVMKGVLANLISQGISVAVNGFKNLARETFEAGSNFEAGMSQVAAISGAGADEIERLTAKAKEMGERTKFSATESAEAFNYMAMAGWKTEDMISGIEGIMNLAAASGEDLATTSDIVTDALTAMGYSAQDAGRLADVMAAASSNANTNVAMMGQTFQYAAPIVGALGYNMEDTAVAIGLMANAGIKGEKAGTALRSILTRLSAPPTECANAMTELGISLTDSEGKMKSLDDIMNDLRVGFDGLSETQQTAYAKSIAGQEAMSGLLAIVNAAPEDFEKLTKAVESSNGAAERMSEVMMDNVPGAITLLRSKVEGIMIKVFEKASSSIRKSINTVSDTLDKIDWDKVADRVGQGFEKLTDIFAWLVDHGDGVVGTLKAIAMAFVTYKAVTTIMSVVGAFQSMTSAIQMGQSAMGLLNSTMGLNPIALVAAAIAGLVVAMKSLSDAQQEAIEAQYGLNKAQQESVDASSEMYSNYASMKEARDESVQGIQSEYGYLHELVDEYNSYVDENGNVLSIYEDRAHFILSELAHAMGVELDAVKDLIEENGKLGESLDDVMRKKQAEAYLMAYEASYSEALKNRTSALITYTEAQDTLSERLDAYDEAQQEANAVMEQYHEMLDSGATQAAQHFLNANNDVVEGVAVAEEAWKTALAAAHDAEDAYVGYNATIENYEGLSSAIMSGEADKIEDAMWRVENGFISTEVGTKRTLKNQVKNMQTSYSDMQTAVNNGVPGVTKAMADGALVGVQRAAVEYTKLTGETALSSRNAGSAFASGLRSKAEESRLAGLFVAQQAKSGTDSQQGGMQSSGQAATSNYAGGLKANSRLVTDAGTGLALQAKSGLDSQNANTYSSGINFSQGFINGIGSLLSSAWSAAKNLAQNALAGLKKGQEERSPSKLTRRSGVFFGRGYELGIESMVGVVANSAKRLAESAYNALSDVQSEGLSSLTDDIQSSADSMNAMIDDAVGNLKANVSMASSFPTGAEQPTISGADGGKQQFLTFNQTINSPKTVDHLTVYRETNSLLFSAKVRLSDV